MRPIRKIPNITGRNQRGLGRTNASVELPVALICFRADALLAGFPDLRLGAADFVESEAVSSVLFDWLGLATILLIVSGTT